jgi:hypothetical protein
MGKVFAFSRRSPSNAEVFSPVNYRPTETCRTLIFDPTDGNNYHARFDAVAIQYALGEQHPSGYHMVEFSDSDGPLIRYIVHRPDGALLVKQHKAFPGGELYTTDKPKVLGFVFQFIRNLDTGERWELITGPAFEGERESAELPLIELPM